jgi:hypothetical protein
MVIGFIGAGLFSGWLFYYQVFNEKEFAKNKKLLKFASVFIVIGFIGAGLFSGRLFYLF